MPNKSLANKEWHSELILRDNRNLASDKNLGLLIAFLKSSQSRELWHKALEEEHVAQVKERSLTVYLLCKEELLGKFLESDIFHILETEGITEMSALFKVSSSKFILIFKSKKVRE